MGIFELFGKQTAMQMAAPFVLDFSFHPLRLSANKVDYVDVTLSLRNTSNEELLTSLVIKVPKGLGFEQSTLTTEKELRFGYMKPGEEKKFRVQIYSSQRTRPGDYPVGLFAISHYRNYGYVLNEIKKSFTLRAV